MIKIIFSLIFICFSFCYKADFSDKIDVYRNGKLIHSTEKFKGDFLFTNLFNIGDTITFHAEQIGMNFLMPQLTLNQQKEFSIKL